MKSKKNDIIKKDLYKAKIKNIEDKISNITNVATNTNCSALNAKINEVKTKITNVWIWNLISENKNKITTDHDHDKCIIPKI